LAGPILGQLRRPALPKRRGGYLRIAGQLEQTFVEQLAWQMSLRDCQSDPEDNGHGDDAP
jgi:hypothetical protein